MSPYSTAETRSTLRVVVHDPPGHAFPIELSRELARRGHHVLHLYTRFFGTPRADVSARAGDPERIEVAEVIMPFTYTKHSYVRRAFQERHYGKAAARQIIAYRPNVVVSAGTPLDAQEQILGACRSADVRFVFWLQDLYSIAISQTLVAAVPLFGALIGAFYRWRERTMLRRSHAVVAISPDFVPMLRDWSIPPERVHVIENWAPLSERQPDPADRRTDPTDIGTGRYLLYAGTLGLKHNGDLLVDLALGLPDARVVVLSEGQEADRIRNLAQEKGLPNLSVLGYRPYNELGRVMAGAEVLVGVLEPEAAVFSVPSKILTYLTAGRPIIAAMPAGNLAARILERANAGIVTPPDDVRALIAAARRLLDDPELARRMGVSGRQYAERAFAIGPIADRFEAVFRGAQGVGS